MGNASALMQSLEATAWLSDTSMQLVYLSEQGWSDSGGKCVDGNSDQCVGGIYILNIYFLYIFKTNGTELIDESADVCLHFFRPCDVTGL